MTTEQLGLFAEADAQPAPTPVTMVGCCRYGCGAHTEVVQNDVGKPWHAAVMWALLPVGQHERFCQANPDRELGPLPESLVLGTATSS